MSDSFLPSGGLDAARATFSPPHTISPMSGVPRTMPMSDFMSPSQMSNHSTPSPRSYMPAPSQHPHGPPLSPPKTRSPSAENTSAALVEDWRAYTTKLRSQNEGERAHMAADRARMEEVMAEERALWDHERRILNARIAELEALLGKGDNAPAAPLASFVAANHQRASITSSGSHPMSTSSSRDGSSSLSVPQESGRNANGSPFYAPAPQNPSRIFDSSERSELRVDSISAPRESAIRVTSKELTASDFIRSPPSTHDLEPIPENIPESIDISHIQPELEGVSIKASAVSPTFAAKILSPQYSPSKLSPNVKPPPRDITNHSNLSRSSSNASNKGNTLEVVNQSENRRLTMHAGHTPNHSISKFSWVTNEDGDSGNSTPRQPQRPEHIHRPSVAPGSEHFPKVAPEEDNSDKALSGPLGLTNDAANDDPFLAALVEKLEEAKRSQPTSPGAESSSSHGSAREFVRQAEDVDEADKEDGPTLRLKPSINFGRPLGRM